MSKIPQEPTKVCCCETPRFDSDEICMYCDGISPAQAQEERQNHDRAIRNQHKEKA